MSHYTNFEFQYTDKSIICKVFKNLGLSYKNTIVKTYGNIKWSVDEYSISEGTKRNAIMAKRNGFNYFMEYFGNHYELSIEKHNMTSSEKRISKSMAKEFQEMYVKEVANVFVNKMQEKGINAVLDEDSKGFIVRFGSIYEKSVLIKMDNGRVMEEVHGVKGESCVSLTEALENMLSSADVELNSEWTEEYYEDPEDGLTIYNLTES